MTTYLCVVILIQPFHPFSESIPHNSFVSMQICRALAYIHNCIGICHRDIKPQNLLVSLFSYYALFLHASNQIGGCNIL